MLNIKKHSSSLIFLAISLFYAAGNFLWWRVNTPILPADPIPIVHYNSLFQRDLLSSSAPLVGAIVKLLFYIFGIEYQDLLIIIVNYAFFLIPLYFIYKIALELKDKKTANIAMILFALVPAVYGMSRIYGHKDYHIIAAITFNVYCLIKTNWFTSRKWSFIYGISTGLGLLVKDPFIGYFAPLFIYTAAVSFKHKINVGKIFNIIETFFVAAAIAAPHYFRQEIFTKLLTDHKADPVPLFVFEHFRVMTIGLWEELLSPPIFLLFIIGLIFFIMKYKHKHKHIILLWFFAPWLMIMLMRHYKLAEYGAGFIPAMVLIAAVWISGIKHNARRIVLGAVIIIGVLQYIDFSYGAINLFNWKVSVNSQYVRYYNKANTNIMAYNGEKMNRVRNFVLYLKNKYPDKTFFVYEYHDIPFHYLELEFHMNMNKMKFKRHYFAGRKYSAADCDVVIVVGGYKTGREIFDIYVNQFEQSKYFNDSLDLYYLEREQLLLEKYFFIADVFYVNKLPGDEVKKHYSDIIVQDDYQIMLLEKRSDNV